MVTHSVSEGGVSSMLTTKEHLEDHTSTNDSNGPKEESPESLAGKSRVQLQEMVMDLSERVIARCNDIADLTKLMTQLKEENVKLSRNLKWVFSKNQELTTAIHNFFKDPVRGEWFTKNKEDTELFAFFQRAITWHRLISKEDDETLSFYRMVWMYEREEAPSEQPLKDDASSSEQRSGFPEILERSTQNLYDVCQERVKSQKLQEEKARLESYNAALLDANLRLEKEVQEVLTSTVPLNNNRSSSSTSQNPSQLFSAIHEVSTYVWGESEEAPKPTTTAKTLADLAANCDMWNRLLEESELFSREDVIDEAYETFLKDVLLIMVNNDCQFRKAIELLGERESGTVSSGDGQKDLLSAENERERNSPVMMPGRPLRLPQDHSDDIAMEST